MQIKCDVSKLPKPLLPPTRDKKGYLNAEEKREAQETIKKLRQQVEWDKTLKRRAAQRRKEAAERVRNTYTPEVDARIIAMLKSGMKHKEIAEELGVSTPSVSSRILRLNGGRKRYGGAFFYTPEQDALIKEMRAQGKSYREIGRRLGKSKDAVWKRAKVIM